MYIGCLCKLQATTHFLYSVCANSRPPLYLLACANSRLVSTYLYLSYLFPSPPTIIRQLPALSPQHQVNTRPDPLHTGVSPFFANKGYHPSIEVNVEQVSSSEAAQMAEELSDLHAHLREQLRITITAYEQATDNDRLAIPPFRVGEYVWLDARNIRTTRPAKKLDYRRLGPYPIIEEVSTHARRLERLRGHGRGAVLGTFRGPCQRTDGRARLPRASSPEAAVVFIILGSCSAPTLEFLEKIDLRGLRLARIVS